MVIDEMHLIDDGQGVDQEVDGRLLDLHQVDGVTEQAESGHVSRPMATMPFHEGGRVLVEVGHGLDRHVVRLLGSFHRHVLQSLFKLLLVILEDPLVKIYRRLSSQWLGQHDHVSWLTPVHLLVLVVEAGHVGDASNDGPRVHDALAARDHGACLGGAIIEALDEVLGDNLPLLVVHLERDSKHHEDVVDSVDAHCVDVGDDVGAGHSPLDVWVLDEGVEEVGR
mmetsp:Transcript_8450/g.14173  ORF Transcript_8450/g.14173 Transcript_8450/m.14173 type:complete len:224 (+) Transcript_8450:609-1280(+)